jgi:hypothetical protein
VSDHVCPAVNFNYSSVIYINLHAPRPFLFSLPSPCFQRYKFALSVTVNLSVTYVKLCSGERNRSHYSSPVKLFVVTNYFVLHLRSWYIDSLRAGRSRDRIPVGGGARFSAPVQTGPAAHSASYKMGTGSLSRG